MAHETQEEAGKGANLLLLGIRGNHPIAFLAPGWNYPLGARTRMIILNHPSQADASDLVRLMQYACIGFAIEEVILLGAAYVCSLNLDSALNRKAHSI